VCALRVESSHEKPAPRWGEKVSVSAARPNGRCLRGSRTTSRRHTSRLNSLPLCHDAAGLRAAGGGIYEGSKAYDGLSQSWSSRMAAYAETANKHYHTIKPLDASSRHGTSMRTTATPAGTCVRGASERARTSTVKYAVRQGRRPLPRCSPRYVVTSWYRPPSAACSLMYRGSGCPPSAAETRLALCSARQQRATAVGRQPEDAVGRGPAGRRGHSRLA
jgi:hypothetical protein